MAGGKLYFADRAAKLSKMDWARNPEAATPVAGTAAVVSGPGIDGREWAARALWVFQGPEGGGAPQPPTAAFTVQCSSLTCDFDGSGSTAPNAQIVSYAWDFGDGSAGSGATPQHIYPTSGTYSVTLTVTTDRGGTDGVTQNVVATQANRAPTAAFSHSCEQLACSFDARTSSDPDGDSLTYAWDFGDGATGTGPTPQHGYAAAGTYPVTLTVSDGSLQDAETRSVSVVAAVVEHVASAGTGGNRTTHTVGVPSSVQAGDRLILMMTTNSSSTNVNNPAGWALLESTDGNGVRGRAWTRLATAPDAGSTVTVTTTATTKATLTLSAYRNPSGTVAVTDSAVRLYDASTATVSTPQVDVVAPGSWLLSYWAEKSSVEPLTWTLPGAVTRRNDALATGSGKVSAVTADSASGVPAGSAGELTATPSATVGRAVAFSLVLAPQ